MRLTETYLALGVRGEAEKAAAVLGANYPGTDWYARAYKLVKEYPPTAIAPLAPGQLVVPVATKPAATPGSAAPAAPTAEPPAAPTAAPTPAPAPATPSSDAPKA